MKHSLSLSIAGFNLKLDSERPIRLEEGYRFFETKPVEAPDITIECRSGFDTGILQGAKQVFASANEEQRFYDVYEKENLLYFVIYDQQSKAAVQQYAKLDFDAKQWTIWAEETDDFIDPLRYPMGPVLLHYLILSADAVMMHASGVFDGEKGRMFSGFSGTGKSTISGIWRNAGNLLVNDDRLIIRRENGRYFMYNTPMYYPDENKKAPLDAVYLIRHSPENVLERATGASAVTGIMAFSIQNNYDTRFVAHHLDFFSRMCAEIPVYRLGFVPDEQVIDFIKENKG